MKLHDIQEFKNRIKSLLYYCSRFYRANRKAGGGGPGGEGKIGKGVRGGDAIVEKNVRLKGGGRNLTPLGGDQNKHLIDNIVVRGI